jgi:hypothetical protein
VSHTFGVPIAAVLETTDASTFGTAFARERPPFELDEGG